MTRFFEPRFHPKCNGKCKSIAGMRHFRQSSATRYMNFSLCVLIEEYPTSVLRAIAQRIKRKMSLLRIPRSLIVCVCQDLGHYWVAMPPQQCKYDLFRK